MSDCRDPSNSVHRQMPNHFLPEIGSADCAVVRNPEYLFRLVRGMWRRLVRCHVYSCCGSIAFVQELNGVTCSLHRLSIELISER